MRSVLVGSLLLAAPAFADWWNVAPPPPPPPVNNPVCVANCGDSSSSSSSSPSSSRTRYVDPEEEARKEAAAEEARREAARRDREALRDFEGSRDRARRLGETGAEVREQARRFSDFREQLEQRETEVRALKSSLAPVVVEKPAAGSRTSLTMQEYCDKLNAAAPPPRSLRSSEVPPLSATTFTTARTAALEAPPTIGPDRFAEVTAAIERAREAMKEDIDDTAQTIAWRLLDRHVPFLKSAREAFESGKANYEALSSLHSRLATTVMTHAEDVAFTVSGSGGTTTPEDNDRVLRSMGRDVNETSSKLLADQARGALKESVLDRASEWLFPGEDP